MEQRTLGRTGRAVSVVGLGTWQLGADWGDVSEDDALAVLSASVDAGVTFFDTADVYGDGRSEQVIGRFLKSHPDITVATKMGRRMDQVPENYTLDNFRAWTDRSRQNLGVDTLDLVQLHCPPSAVIDADATYDDLDTLVADGAIAAYGVSVETVAQALSAIARPNVASIQIILNAFRLKPLDEVLPAARGGRSRDHRAGAAGVRAAVREVRREHDVRGRRPPHLQPRRRGVRRGRDVLGRRLRDRRAGGQGVHRSRGVCRRRCDGCPGCARVGRPAAGRLDGDPRRPERRPGSLERGRGRARAAAGGAFSTALRGCTTRTSARPCTRAGRSPGGYPQIAERHGSGLAVAGKARRHAEITGRKRSKSSRDASSLRSGVRAGDWEDFAKFIPIDACRRRRRGSRRCRDSGGAHGRAPAGP